MIRGYKEKKRLMEYLKKNKTTDKRIEWIDFARGICMICVMLTHIEFCPAIYRTFFAPFFLSMFFSISGYLFKKRRNFGENFIHKTKTLLVPFLIFGLINILTRQIITFNEQGDVFAEFKKFFLQIGNDSGLWFIACLYIASIIFQPISRLYKKNAKVYIILISVLELISIIYARVIGISLPWHIDKIGMEIFYMGLGSLYKEKYEQKLAKYENKKTLLYVIISYLLLLIINYILFRNTYVSFDSYKNIIVLNLLLCIV